MSFRFKLNWLLILGLICLIGLILSSLSGSGGRLRKGTVRTSPPAPTGDSFPTAHLGRLFEDGRMLTNEFGPIVIKVKTVGEVNLPSGRIVACDAFVFGDQPLSTTIRPGRYPVILCLAQFTNDERVACAKLQFTTNAVVRWEQDGAYGVDSGTGCYMDVKTAQAYNRKIEANQNYAYQLINAFGRKEMVRSVNFMVESNSELNLIAFQSGFGDGGYPCFRGLDQAGEVACVVTDFGLLQDQH